jgi:predicted nucleic acid-binding protein
VLDTDTLVSAVISADGPQRRLLDAARTQVFDLCSSAVMLAELLDEACAVRLGDCMTG